MRTAACVRQEAATSIQAPSGSIWCRNCCTSADLPIPGSPIPHCRPSLPSAARHRQESNVSSPWRPKNRPLFRPAPEDARRCRGRRTRRPGRPHLEVEHRCLEGELGTNAIRHLACQDDLTGVASRLTRAVILTTSPNTCVSRRPGARTSFTTTRPEWIPILADTFSPLIPPRLSRSRRATWISGRCDRISGRVSATSGSRTAQARRLPGTRRRTRCDARLLHRRLDRRHR